MNHKWNYRLPQEQEQTEAAKALAKTGISPILCKLLLEEYNLSSRG